MGIQIGADEMPTHHDTMHETVDEKVDPECCTEMSLCSISGVFTLGAEQVFAAPARDTHSVVTIAGVLQAELALDSPPPKHF